MSILIKGMEMPESCIECDFCGGVIYPDGIYCCDCPPEISRGKNVTENIENDNRPGWCPLVEVPTPHGRLIDADATMKQWGLDKATKYGNETSERQHFSYSTMMMYEIADIFDDALTVIKAERTE